MSRALFIRTVRPSLPDKTHWVDLVKNGKASSIPGIQRNFHSGMNNRFFEKIRTLLSNSEASRLSLRNDIETLETRLLNWGREIEPRIQAIERAWERRVTLNASQMESVLKHFQQLARMPSKPRRWLMIYDSGTFSGQRDYQLSFHLCLKSIQQLYDLEQSASFDHTRLFEILFGVDVKEGKKLVKLGHEIDDMFHLHAKLYVNLVDHKGEFKKVFLRWLDYVRVRDMRGAKDIADQALYVHYDIQGALLTEVLHLGKKDKEWITRRERLEELLGEDGMV